MPTADPVDIDSELRAIAIREIEREQRLKLRVAAFCIGMLVLVPVWVAIEYLGSGGWPERLSNGGNPGDWSPWIVWVALAWGFYVVMTAVALRLRRPTTEDEIDRKLEQLRAQTTRP